MRDNLFEAFLLLTGPAIVAYLVIRSVVEAVVR